ncbi:MAG: 50S ribosomal protein L21e [Candidatus Woesearchaeota archaeon]
MAKRIGGFRRKTRYKLRKIHRTKGKVSLERIFQRFEIGETVQLVAEPSIQKGLYHPRFHGKHGKIIGQQGSAYLVEVKDFNKKKQLIVAPVHLKPIPKA